jgi:poly-gamma-glutamate synthesis protein (capsule biosynthesis protein)
MIRRVPLIVLSALVTFGCAQSVTVSISVPDRLRSVWEQLLDDAPPPELVVLEQSADPMVTLRETVGVAGHRERADSIVLARTWLSPTADLWDLDATYQPDGDLLPLSTIKLPRRALPVSETYPDDPEYPYVRELSLDLTQPDPGVLPRRTREPLALWFEQLRGAAREMATAVPDGPPEIFWVAGVGDIMLERGMTGLLLREDGLELVFSDVLPHMLDADLLLGNLEGAVSRRGSALDKGFTFRFDPVVLGPLEQAGFDYLTIVNNHSYDYGEIAFLDSIDYLNGSSIGTSGAGRSLAEASIPWQISVGETEVRVLAAGAYPVERSGFDGARTTVAAESRPGVLWAGPRNPGAQQQMFAAMERAFSESSFDIVSVHGGAEWAIAPAEWQRSLYRELIDRGADLVLGHHSHVVQGMEAYNGKLIAYSLGNFVFPGMFLTEFGEQSLLLRVGVVDGEIRYVEPIPVEINHQLLKLDTGNELRTRLAAATMALSREE